MDLRLQGKTVLITGASQGIGRETALLLAEEGCNLVLVSRNDRRLNDIADTIHRQHGVSVGVLVADLSSEAEVKRVSSSMGDIDVLVNNAGAIPPPVRFRRLTTGSGEKPGISRSSATSV